MATALETLQVVTVSTEIHRAPKASVTFPIRVSMKPNGSDWEVYNCETKESLPAGDYQSHFNIRHALKNSGCYPQQGKATKLTVRSGRLCLEGRCPKEVWEHLLSIHFQNVRARELHRQVQTDIWEPQIYRFLHGNFLHVRIGQEEALKKIGIVFRQHVDLERPHTHVYLTYVRSPYVKEEWTVAAILAILI